MYIYMKSLATFIDSTTMYRVVLYGLSALAFLGVIFGFTGIISYSGSQLLLSLGVLLVTGVGTQYLYAKWYRAPAHLESTLITVLILFFIMSPPFLAQDVAWLALGAFIALSSKFVVAFHNKHLFNPAAFAVVVLGFTSAGGAIWWIGSAVMLPATLLVGLVVVYKIRRTTLFLASVVASLLVILVVGFQTETPFGTVLLQHFISWPIIFFASIMITEPSTTPPTKRLQIFYGVLVGALSSLPYHFGFIFSTPELALIIGNIFSYTFSLKHRLELVLKEKIQTARDTYEFVFQTKQPFVFQAGQYLEWTLPHPHPDSRGTRRFFTIASSPTEKTVRLGVRFNPNASTYKKKLLSLQPGDTLLAGPLSGDFTLPQDERQKLVFIAGGIGITPFRSMFQYLIDSKEKRDLVLLYSNKSFEDISYQNFLDEAERVLTAKIVYVLTDKTTTPSKAGNYEQGYITESMVRKHVTEWQNRWYYISGPNAMVESYKKVLTGMGVSQKNIKTDYFTGYA
jgi:glycine betaine catabolism B